MPEGGYVDIPMPARTRPQAASRYIGAAMVAVGLGGAAGATCRWALATTTHGSLEDARWPWPTLAANAVGCLLLGVIAARLPFVSQRAVVVWRDALGTGFCGGLTTFSTFSVEVAAMLREHRPGLAVGYIGASLVSGYLLYELGRRFARRRLL
jgi:CrcB protein